MRWRLRASMACSFSTTSSRMIATWMFRSSSASLSICRRCWISSKSDSWVALCSAAVRSRGGVSMSASPCGVAVETDSGAPTAECGDGSSSAMSHSPKSIRFTTFKGAASRCCGGGFTAARSSRENIRKPMSSSESSATSAAQASFDPPKSQSSSTALFGFLPRATAFSLAAAFALAATSFCRLSSMAWMKPRASSSEITPRCSFQRRAQFLHFSFLKGLGSNFGHLSGFGVNCDSSIPADEQGDHGSPLPARHGCGCLWRPPAPELWGCACKS
mmetsp:Transcript_129998/g.290247  ORF Transcript_129998/g.290247 Transcript_129998/m.290247 type:complete len:274 (-) Transcript_129998:7-828(-)